MREVIFVMGNYVTQSKRLDDRDIIVRSLPKKQFRARDAHALTTPIGLLCGRCGSYSVQCLPVSLLSS